MSGDKYTISDQRGCYFLTFTVIYWMDVFSRREYRDILVESLNYCIATKGLVVYAWVIMTNHIHLIASTKEDGENLSNIIRDFKKYTSRKIVSAIQNGSESRKEWMLEEMNKEAKRIGRATNYKLWKDDNHAIYLDDHGTGMQDCLDYIHDYPVVNGLVSNAWEYLYSSAMDYEINTKGLVNIDLI